MNKKDQAKITDVISNVISLLGVPTELLQVEIGEEMITIQLDLPEEDSGVFIGHQGETLGSLQLVLALIVSQRLDNWTRVKVNVGDYQQRREQLLITRADEAAQRALETGQEIIIPGLNSYERHLVHEHLSENANLVTESRGEEPHRQLFVAPQSK